MESNQDRGQGNNVSNVNNVMDTKNHVGPVSPNQNGQSNIDENQYYSYVPIYKSDIHLQDITNSRNKNDKYPVNG